MFDFLIFLVGMVVLFYACWSVYLSERTLARIAIDAGVKGEPRPVTHALGLPLHYLWLFLDIGVGVTYSLVVLWEVPKKERLAMSENLRYYSANSEGRRARIVKITLKLLKPFRER